MYNVNQPTYHIDVFAEIERSSEVPDANWGTGADYAASNSPGIGINIHGGPISGEPQQFTLEDQFENTRTPEAGQVIGGSGFNPAGNLPSSGGQEGRGFIPVFTSEPSASGDGNVTSGGESSLETLGVGWISVSQ